MLIAPATAASRKQAAAISHHVDFDMRSSWSSKFAEAYPWQGGLTNATVGASG
jgi:hypothetical protein